MVSKRSKIQKNIGDPAFNENWLSKRMNETVKEVNSWKPWMREAMGVGKQRRKIVINTDDEILYED